MVSVPIWNAMGDKVNDLEPGEGRWHAYSVALLVLYGFYVLISHFRMKGGAIHRICLLWWMIMVVVVFFNPSGFFDNLKLFLWPLIFEMACLSMLCFSGRLYSIKNVFWVIFSWGTFLFLTSEGRFHFVWANAVFTPLLTAPVLMLGINRKYQLLVLIVMTLLVLVSMKRSSMLIIAASWLVYGLPLLKIRNKIVSGILFGGLFLLGLVIFDKMNNALGGKIEERINREETDTGRNRLAIWGVTWMMIEQSSIKEYIVGHGHFGVRRDSILEISAHNDFLEVIYDYGVIAFILYIGLWYYVLNRWWYLRKTDSPMFFPYSISVVIFVFMSLVSHLILYTAYFNFLVMFWGICEGVIINNKRTISKKE